MVSSCQEPGQGPFPACDFIFRGLAIECLVDANPERGRELKGKGERGRA